MLTITLYNNVPFEKNYSDVLHFNGILDKLSYLNSYKAGVIENINKFFANETFIDLPQYYERCNYMLIQDDRSAEEYKFFFIDNVNFISGVTIRYSITLDVWFTYSNIFNFGYATFTGGHADVITNKDSEFTTDYNVITGTEQYYTNERVGKKLLNRYPSVFTMIAIINELGSEQQGTFENPRILVASGNSYDMLKFYNGLGKNKYKLIAGQTEVDKEFESLKCYLIPDFNLQAYYNDYHGSYETARLYKYNYGGSEYIDAYLILNRYEWYDEDTQTWYIDHFNIVHNIEIKNDVPFYNMNSYDNFKYKFKIGTINNNIEIKPFMYNNATMKLYLTILNYNQLSINLEYEGNLLDLTNDFEVPVINDSYTLYMAQNQARFATANKQAIVNAGVGVVTAGMGLSKPQNATAGVIGAINQIEMQNALNSDMGRASDRVDTSFTSAYLTVLYGVGCFAFEIRDKYLAKYINDYGVIGNYKTNKYRASNNELSLYNFTFVRFDNLDIGGYFNYDIKTKLIDIFKKGVRIWYDTQTFKTDVNYKK